MRTVLLGVALVATLGARPAAAAVTDCSALPGGATWCKETAAAALSAPVGTTSLGYPRTFAANGGNLEILDSASGVSVRSIAGVGTVSNRPMPVRFASSGARAVFVASTSGYLFRIDPETGDCVWKSFLGRTTSSDLTPGCTGSVVAQCPGDQVTATPAVRFGASEAESIVYVGTRYTTTGGTCGTATRNRVYALDAATGDPVWVFNQATGAGSPYRNSDGAAAVNFIAEGVYPDVYEDGCGSPGVRDRVYVGADNNGSQSTAWSLDALTGSAIAIGDIGGIQTTPVLSFNPDRCERVYFATKSPVGPAGNALIAVGISASACTPNAAPCVLWIGNTSGPVFLNPGVVNTSSQRGRILVTSSGRTQLFVDNGASVAESCSYGGGSPQVSSQALILGSNGVAYVGTRDGTIAQISLTDCTPSATLRTLQAGTLVGDASLDADATFQNPFIVVGNDSGRIARFNVPW